MLSDVPAMESNRATDPDNYTYPVLGYALQKESQELFNDYVKEVHCVVQLNVHE